MVEVLLSLRVNALQIAPELRKNLVYELIRNDIFRLNEDKEFKMLIKMLERSEAQMKHAITSMISVIASTLRGVEYLTQGNNFYIIRCVIRILKESEPGSVT